MDPDYELTETVRQQAKEREERDKTESVERIKTTINNEFKRELEFREKQLEQIQVKLAKASKTLHLLRYVLVTSYYNHNEVQFQQTDEELHITDSQNRLHPAIKKIVSDNVAFGLDLNRRKSMRMKTQFKNIVIQESDDTTLKQIEEIQADDFIKQEVEDVKCESEVNNIPRNRVMVKKRIVVGNISKWMPSESTEDHSTHKWMMYVRGPKESPNIDDFVEKVIFYLHPSYQPNDVIELKGPPFHLSRRGWGEFSLRVQIFFNCILNKPVDIIHNLKLDRTYTGRQTLGNETIVDLTIYTNDKLESAIELEQSEAVVEYPTEILEKTEIESIVVFNPLFDHTYALTNVNNGTKAFEEDAGNYLKKRKRPQEYLLLENYNKRVKHEDISCNNVNYERYKVNMPENRFKNVLEALPYLLKRLPLVTTLGDQQDYKCTYPYVAASMLEYRTWPLEKILSSEWSRAKAVQRILKAANLDRNGKWVTKRILAYARSHGFTQLINWNMLKSLNYDTEYLFGNSENIPLKKTSLQVGLNLDVDITQCEEEESITTSKLNLVETRLSGPLTYVKQAAFEVGVLLKPEEIIPGVMYNASQRVLLKAVMCLAENLIRNARGIQAHQENSVEEDCLVRAEDIRKVLNNHRPEFNLILNFKKEESKY